MRPETKEKYIRDIANWFNVTRKTLLHNFSKKEIDKMLKLWDDSELIQLHGYGYSIERID